ncbi:helix-turn-helix transcriptional regulator [Microtetraspora fusca]|uniref:helix-turn-helix transcriptional regulator n=1 Tax=Microtetraspora fusca TaxID=1997 RepID=UPI000B07DC1D|nr:LuxR family transcriptional regulator [Microtetraspora fusca]
MHDPFSASPGLIGRAAELGRVDRAVGDVAAGRFRTVSITGSPGIGKTRLLAELGRRAGERGFAVMSGRATEFERCFPFAVYVEALTPWSPPHPDDAEARAALETLVSISRGDREPEASIDRYRLYRGIRRLLEVAPGSIALLLDDLHWADQPSLELTEYLLRKPPRGGLLVAVAYRPAPLPTGVVAALPQADDQAVFLDLRPLEEKDLAELFPGAGAHRRRLLHRASAGNPLYLHALADAGDSVLAGLTGGEYPVGGPRALQGLLLAELDVLPHDLRRVAQALAVAGDQASLDLVAWIAETGEEETADALDRLCAQGAVVPTDAFFTFRHPLLRAAVYREAGMGWRTRAHERAAAYLDAHRGPVTLLAHHVQRSARQGDEGAAAILHEAAAGLLDVAPATASRLLRTALRVLPAREDLTARRMAMLMALARAVAAVGELAESREILKAVLPGPEPTSLEAAGFASVLSRLMGDLDAAKHLLARMLNRGADSCPHTANILIELAALDSLRLDSDEAWRHALAALEQAGELGHEALAATAHSLLALNAAQQARIGDAEVHVERATRLADGVADAELRPHAALFAPLALVEAQLNLRDQAARHLAKGLELVGYQGLNPGFPFLRIVEVVLLTREGRLSAAVAAAEEAAELAAFPNSHELTATVWAAALPALLWLDGPQAALAAADRLIGPALPRSAWWSELTRLNLATVDFHAGRVAACLAQLTAGPWSPQTAVGAGIYRQALHAVSAARFNDLHSALLLSDLGLADAKGLGLDHQLGAAHMARAEVLLQYGELEEALPHASAAATYFADAGAPIDEGRARQLLATLHSRNGDPKAMRDELARAKARYAECSAAWLEKQLAKAELRMAASLSRQAEEPAGLSERERQIATLAGSGLTNREIAQRLYLSPKTVEAHLARVFAKLDVRSRVELTRRLAEEGISPERSP